MFPMREQPGAMKDVYRELNAHNPNTDFQNKQTGGGHYADQRGDRIQNVRAADNAQSCCIKSCIKLTRATYLFKLYYMLNNDKHYWIIDIPLNVLATNYNTNYIDCTIINRVQVKLKVS